MGFVGVLMRLNLLFSCYHIFALTTCSLTRRLHILLRLPRAGHGWNGRGGQACESADVKDRCQLMCLTVCVCPALNREGTLYVDTDVYSTAGRLFSCWNSGLDFVSSWLWRLIVRFCCWLLTRCVLIFDSVCLSVERNHPLMLPATQKAQTVDQLQP